MANLTCPLAAGHWPGHRGLAAYAVVLNSLSLILGLGFMTATLTMVGLQIGAGKEQEVQETGWRNLRLAWLLMGGAALLFLMWPQVVRLFSNDPVTIAQVGLGLGIVPMLNTLYGHWCIRLPLILLFIGPLEYGLNGFWIAMVIEMFVRVMLNVQRFRSKFWLYASQAGV